MRRSKVTAGALLITAALAIGGCSGGGAAKTETTAANPAETTAAASSAAEETTGNASAEETEYGSSGSEVLRLAKDSETPEGRQEITELLESNNVEKHIKKGNVYLSGKDYIGDSVEENSFYGDGTTFAFRKSDPKTGTVTDISGADAKQNAAKNLFPLLSLNPDEYLGNVSGDEKETIYELVSAYSPESLGFSYVDEAGKEVQNPAEYLLIRSYTFENDSDVLKNVHVYIQKNTELPKLVRELNVQWDVKENPIVNGQK
ncbi:MAG: hypothetical protein K5760_08805 [Clostridium sp.]|nr:hypothetical protein [Clostridium sp.]